MQESCPKTCAAFLCFYYSISVLKLTMSFSKPYICDTLL